jgi:hypothetical protein
VSDTTGDDSSNAAKYIKMSGSVSIFFNLTPTYSPPDSYRDSKTLPPSPPHPACGHLLKEKEKGNGISLERGRTTPISLELYWGEVEIYKLRHYQMSLCSKTA